MTRIMILGMSLSLVVLAIAIFARYARNLASGWRFRSFDGKLIGA